MTEETINSWNNQEKRVMENDKSSNKTNNINFYLLKMVRLQNI